MKGIFMSKVNRGKKEKKRPNSLSVKNPNLKIIIDEIKKRKTDELVIAFCGPLGGGISEVADTVVNILEEYKYETQKIKLSDLIIDSTELDEVRTKITPELKRDEKLENIKKIIEFNKPLREQIAKIDYADKTWLLQSAGNALRKIFSNNDVVAQLAIKEITVCRQTDKDGVKKKSRRVATILDSLKHPEEVTLLRTVYDHMFYLFGVLCPEELRQNRLIKQKKIKKIQAIKLMDRDKSEDEKFGQKLIETLHFSDFFVRNTKENITAFKPRLDRFIKLILGDPQLTPTKDESAMYYAQSAAVRSGCLSRQVGASIIDDNGNLISTGCNDVPKYGGGLYSFEDGDNDNRCMNLQGGRCQNDESIKDIFNDIKRILKNKIARQPELQDGILDKIREHDRLKGLIEYCRAIHAEMNAIINSLGNGNISLKGKSMFITTFPCHNCARHIIASGIKAVYYIEPYEKSLAIQLHSDAIKFDPEAKSKDDRKKVIFVPFEGVAPRQYLNLFRQTHEKKYNGQLFKIDLKKSKPIVAQLLDSYFECEAKVVQNLILMGFKESGVSHPAQKTQKKHR
jgi:deoxycytidylate deaminase